MGSCKPRPRPWVKFVGEAMRVLMVDDHLMFLQGLKNLLGAIAPELSLDTAESLAKARQQVAKVPYDLVLLDWHLEAIDGETTIATLREAGCAARIVVLSGETDPKLIRRAIEIGAAGFIPKRYSSELMLAALDLVIKGAVFLPPEALKENAAREAATPVSPDRLVEAQDRLAGLTPRQIDVYRAAARGLPNKLIARELGIAESTVKTHLTSVFNALGVRNRTEAAYQASREGIRVG
jgi:DNA-binding NarL/FixJ family response regulator